SERERFPVFELELGDSWIHGSGSYPVKTARFLALQRLYDRFATYGLDARRLAFGRGLAMVAEHTCGLEIGPRPRLVVAQIGFDIDAAG
ncbi:hypothetical protein AB9E13_34025, partial [Rhizobium leguminosarum]